MRLALLATAALALCAFTHGSQYTVLGDSTNYSKGPYGGYLGPFCAGALLPGVGYTESLAVTAGSFPSQSVITWSWPATPPPSCGEYGFLQLSYGNYDGGAQTITAKQLSAIATESFTFSAAYGGTLSGFDVISDRFCWPAAVQVANAQTCEIEVFVHPNATSIAFFNGGATIGAYTDASGRAWSVAWRTINGIPDYLFMPTAETDITAGTIDLKGEDAYLIAQAKLTGAEWDTGFAALGAEPRTDAGTLTVNALSVVRN